MFFRLHSVLILVGAAACLAGPGCVQTKPEPKMTRLQSALDSLQEKAVTHYELGEYGEALDALEKIEILAKGMDDLVHLANAYNNIAAVHFELKDFKAAARYLELSYELNKKTTSPRAEAARAENLLNLASLNIELRNQTKSEAYLRQAEELLEKRRDESGLVQVVRNRGKIQEFLSDFSAAIELYSEALDRARNLEDPRLTAAILTDIGQVREKMGEHDKALELYQAALALDKEHELFIGVAKDLRIIGRIYEKKNDVARAWEYHERALNVYRIRIGHKPWILAQVKTLLRLAKKRKDKPAEEKYTKLLAQYAPPKAGPAGENAKK